ncbi:MAG TPA: transcriptional initiation protein Tat [Acetobacteraceae bacterium]|jgi:hypothetical protein|nr:transcriptional initiation protein Tat [Acetobacteraceae bacterium]
MQTARRQSLKVIGLALVSAGLAGGARAESLVPAGARTLEALTKRLASLPRRRDFKSLPMILDHRDQWDADALDAVLRYAGNPKQSWDNTDISGPWLNVMRNAMNSQVWSFRHPDFLCLSVTHGPAQLALYDDSMWEKYGLAKLAGGKLTHNSFVTAPAAADSDPKDYQNPNGAYSPRANSIQALQRRGAVFLACHNAAWELSEKLIAADTNPDKLSAEAMCAELTNHLIPGVVMTPGAVGTLVELAKAGFAYAR